MSFRVEVYGRDDILIEITIEDGHLFVKEYYSSKYIVKSTIINLVMTCIYLPLPDLLYTLDCEIEQPLMARLIRLNIDCITDMLPSDMMLKGQCGMLFANLNYYDIDYYVYRLSKYDDVIVKEGPVMRVHPVIAREFSYLQLTIEEVDVLPYMNRNNRGWRSDMDIIICK